LIRAAAGSLALPVRAWIEILACRARLRMPRILRTEAFLRREIAGGTAAANGGPPLERLLEAFERALRAQPGTPACLPRSLALRRFLAHHGHAARLALGLRRAGGRLQGHAWVEAGGAILTRDEAFARAFVPLRAGTRGRCDV
jgi:hypothetical protein